MIPELPQFTSRGELETIHGIEPLPPTEISPEAEDAFLNWGLSFETIQKLRELTALFRYDLCVEKAERIASRPIYAGTETGEAVDFVYVPYYLDVQGSLDGQCLDIAHSWLLQMEFSGLLDRIREEVVANYPGYRVVTNFSDGFAETHFVSGEIIDYTSGGPHYWNGLTLLGPESNIAQTILVDASLQKIKLKHGYQAKNTIRDPKQIEKYPTVRMKSSLLSSEYGSYGLLTDEPGDVLGMSYDYQYAYGINFGFDKATGKMVPILKRLHADGRNTEIFTLNPSSKLLNVYPPGVELTPEHAEEIGQILHLLSQVNYAPEQDMPDLLRKTAVVKLK